MMRRGRPYFPRFEKIPHYYGDVVRMLFVATAIIMLFGAPYYADTLYQELPFIVVGAVILIALGALTSPQSVLAIRLDAVFAGVVAVVFEVWALWGYEAGSSIEFIIRQTPAILSIFAFYYSLKTLRSMLTGLLGQADPAEEAIPLADVDGVPLDALGHRAAIEDNLGEDM